MRVIVTLFALAVGGSAAALCPATIPGAPTGNAAERERGSELLSGQQLTMLPNGCVYAGISCADTW